VAGVEVADRSDRFVVAGGEGRAGMNGRFRAQNRTVQLNRNLSHSLCLINLLDCEKFGGQSAEYLLGRRNHAARLVNPSGDVQQTEHDAARTDTKKIMEVAALPLAVIQSGKIGSVDYGDVRLQ
jgi:hypothetical protein